MLTYILINKIENRRELNRIDPLIDNDPLTIHVYFIFNYFYQFYILI